jgi:hypothetical protein
MRGSKTLMFKHKLKLEGQNSNVGGPQLRNNFYSLRSGKRLSGFR